ncbi:ABC transporter permease [Paludisphaera sp.]|uniref:ABC transporter permease n=1 Tax=Paludisphaera sp. TaxID=2017432 RepID=UPI00301C94B0
MIEPEATLAAPAHRRDAPHAPADPALEVVIRPTPGWRAVNWAEMYEFRELLGYLVWRDVAARYKQSVLGPAWALLQPMIMVVIFTFVSRFLSIPMPDGLPAPVVIFAALIPWTMFAQGMPAAAGSLVASINMVTKVYFPRLFLPFAAAAVFLVDGILTLPVFGLLLAYYGVAPSWTIVFLPVFYLLTLIAALGIGVALAALTAFYRDFKHIVPFLVQIMMYVTPVFYTIEPTIPARWRPVLALNPMFGITDGFRATALGLPMPWVSLLISTASALAIFTAALFYFRRSERLFADHV